MGGDSLCFAHGFAFDVEPVGVVDESVEDGVGESSVANGFVPEIDGQLGRDQGGLRVVAIVEDLEQIAAMRILEGCAQPVVEHDQVHVVESGELVLVGSVGPGDVQVVQEQRSPEVPGREAFLARPQDESRRQECLADTRWTSENDVPLIFEPPA